MNVEYCGASVSKVAGEVPLLPILNSILYMHLAMDRAEMGNGISPGFFAFQVAELEYYNDGSIKPLLYFGACMHVHSRLTANTAVQVCGNSGCLTQCLKYSE